MRPVLIEIPSKLLLVVAILWGIAALVVDIVQRRKEPGRGWSSTPITMLIAAVAILKLRGGAFVPSGEQFAQPWPGVPIHSYGVMLGTSMIVGWFLAMKLAKQDGIPVEAAGAIYMWAAVVSIVGARILYCIVNYDELESPLDVLKIWQGGMVAYGGMIGGFLGSWYACRKYSVPLLRWADVSAPSVVLGTAITRIGCLLFGCDYGQVAKELPFAITFPPGSPAFRDHVEHFGLARDAAASLPVHPTQLYEMLAGLLLFALLMFLRRVRRFSGVVFLGWVIGYGILRPIIEAFRDDDQRGSIGPLSTSQFIGITSVVLGIGLLVVLIRRYRQDPAALRLWEQPLVLEPAAAAPSGPARGGPARAAKPRRRR